MEQHLIISLLLAVAGMAAACLLLRRGRPSAQASDEPQEYSDIYQSTLIALLYSTGGPLGFQSRRQHFTQPAISSPQYLEAPRDYAPWDDKARDALDEALALNARP